MSSITYVRRQVQLAIEAIHAGRRTAALDAMIRVKVGLHELDHAAKDDQDLSWTEIDTSVEQVTDADRQLLRDLDPTDFYRNNGYPQAYAPAVR